MEVDTSASEARARQVAAKKSEQEIEDQKLNADLSRASRERQRLLETEREKSEKQLVEISQNAANQMDATKKINADRVHALSENTQTHYQDLAQKTAEEIKRQDAEALKAVNSRKASAMEKVRMVTEQSEDPFYRLKSLNPNLQEHDKEYTIQVKLPEHEAKNLYIAGEGPYLKLTLARRYQDNVKNEEENRITRTNSFQTVVESVAMPGPYDPKKIEKTYADGMVTIRVPKQIFGAPDNLKI